MKYHRDCYVCELNEDRERRVKKEIPSLTVGHLLFRWEYLLFHFWNSCRVVIFLSLAIVFLLFPNNSEWFLGWKSWWRFSRFSSRKTKFSTRRQLEERSFEEDFQLWNVVCSTLKEETKVKLLRVDFDVWKKLKIVNISEGKHFSTCLKVIKDRYSMCIT